MEFQSLRRVLIVVGAVALILGAVVSVSRKLPLQLPFFGRLPGDQPLKRNGYTLFLPIATMALLSLVITVVANLVSRCFR